MAEHHRAFLPGRAMVVLIVLVLTTTISFAISGCAGASATGSVLTGPVPYGDGGWEMVPIPVPQADDLYGLTVSCWSATECLASESVWGGGLLLVTTDGGLSWDDEEVIPGYIGALSCRLRGPCVALASEASGILVARNPAEVSSWKPVTAPAFEPQTLTPETVACSRRFCMVIGTESDGSIPRGAQAAFVSSNWGRSWQRATLPPGAKDVQALSCMPDGHCYFVYDTFSHQYSDMAMSVDEGRTWRAVHKAPGFTSLTGFSCPTDQGCLYLGDHVLEASSGTLPTWSAWYGPFSKDDPKKTGAWALSCVSLTRCMIGGTSAYAAQQVAWTWAPPWSSARIEQSLRYALASGTTRFAQAAIATGITVSSTGNDAEVENVVAIAEANESSIGTIALHARGSQQLEISTVSDDWGRVATDLDQLPGSVSMNGGLELLAQSLIRDAQRLLRAEEVLGYHPQGNDALPRVL